MRPIVYAVLNATYSADVANGYTIPIPVDVNRVTGNYSIQYMSSLGAGTVQATSGINILNGTPVTGFPAIMMTPPLFYVSPAATATTQNGVAVPPGTPILDHPSQVVAGTGVAGTGTVQYTLDDVFSAYSLAQAIGGAALPNINWSNVTLVGGKANVAAPVRAFRIQTPAVGDVLSITAQGSGTGG